MKKHLVKILFTALITLSGLPALSQTLIPKASFNPDCHTDFWTITVDGFIQQWSLSGGVISGGDTILFGGGQSLSYCGDSHAPTFFTDNWNQGEIGINYYDPDSGWLNIPTEHHVQDNGGHLQDQYYTVVGAVIQYVTYWDGANLMVIDSLPGEFFAGIFDTAVDTSGHAWIFTAAYPGIAMDSLKVYDPGGQIRAYAFPYSIQGYGSFFLNDTLYLGTLQDSIFPVIVNGNTAQLGVGIPFPARNFTDMASCQATETTSAGVDAPIRTLRLFPNPTDAYLVVPIEMENATILVYNSMGQFIPCKREGMILDLREQAPGMYYVKISTEDGSYAQPVIKH